MVLNYSLRGDPEIEEENIKNGNAAVDKLIEAAKNAEDTSKLVITNAMYRSDIGYIDFKWGTPGKGAKFKGGYGISHIIAKRNYENGNGKDVASKLVESIAKATEYDLQNNGQVGNDLARIRLYYKGYTVVLVKEEKRNSWLLTGWGNKKEATAYATGEGNDSSGATAASPTRTRAGGVNASASKNSIPASSENSNRKIKGSAVARDSEGRITNSELAEEINSAGLVLTSRENNKNNVRINAWIKEHHPELHGLVSFKNDNSTGKVTVIDISTQEEVEDIRNKENERYQRKLAEERFFNRVKTISGNNALYESMKNHILKGGYSERGVEIHRSRSVVGSNSFYIEDAERDITIKISDHNTIGQQMSYQNTAFIDLHNYASMKEVWNKVADILDDGISDSSEKSTATEGGVKGSIVSIEGKRYVKAERNVLSGDNPGIWAKQIERYINEEIRKGKDIILPTTDNHLLILTERSAYKMSDRHIASIAKKVEQFMNDESFSLKGRIATHIDEMIQVAKFREHSADKNGKHENDIGEEGFNYYDAFFEDFDGGYYRIRFSAALNGEKETAYSIGKVTKRKSLARGGSSSNKGGALTGNDSFKSIIRTSGPNSQEVKTAVRAAFEKAMKDNSNRKIKGSAVARDSEGRSLSKEQVEYFKDSNTDNLNSTENPDIRFSAAGTEEVAPRRTLRCAAIRPPMVCCVTASWVPLHRSGCSKGFLPHILSHKKCDKCLKMYS